MKNQAHLRRLRTGLALSVALFALSACSPVTVPDTTAPGETQSPSDTSLTALQTYYEALIADLKQTVSDMKQADYILRTEYESRIADLENQLAALETPPTGTDIPVGTEPDRPSDTAAPTITAPEPPTAMAFHYRMENGTAVICEYLGNETHVTIPNAIEGYPVTRIADNAFQGTAVTSVTVPVSVTEIGWFAFAECTALTSVTLPASVTSIGYGAFDGCPNLTVYCPKDSHTAQFAASFGLRVKYE